MYIFVAFHLEVAQLSFLQDVNQIAMPMFFLRAQDRNAAFEESFLEPAFFLTGIFGN